jgi:hypothetical protein
MRIAATNDALLVANMQKDRGGSPLSKIDVAMNKSFPKLRTKAEFYKTALMFIPFDMRSEQLVELRKGRIFSTTPSTHSRQRTRSSSPGSRTASIKIKTS